MATRKNAKTGTGKTGTGTRKKAAAKGAAAGTRKKTTGRKTASAARSSRKKISYQELWDMVEKEAYILFLDRGSSHGDDQYDWYRAERNVLEGLKKNKVTIA